MAESVATVPATTRSPTALRTGRDSPVIIDSSTSASPSTTTPSAGTGAPDRTSTTSPGASVVEGDRLDAVVGDPLGLVGQQRGERVERARGLAEGPHLQPVAEQHDHDEERELPPEVEVETADAERGGRLATNATVIAMATSSIMPGWRAVISRRAPLRNGQPP